MSKTFMLKKLREKKGISQMELGDVINVSAAAVSLYETGQREPGFDTLIKLADFFSVTTDCLLGHDGAEKEPQTPCDNGSLPEGMEERTKRILDALDGLTLDECRQLLNRIRRALSGMPLCFRTNQTPPDSGA